MKIMKLLGVLVVLAVGVFLLVGIVTPTFEYSSSITVRATPDKCWEVLHDTSRMKKWIDGFQSITLKHGQPMQVGAVYEIIIVQDEKYVMSEVLKEITIPVKVAFELTNDVMVSEYDYVFTGNSKSTEVVSHFRISGNNLAWKSVLFLSKSYLKENADNQLARFKIEVEAGDMEFD